MDCAFDLRPLVPRPSLANVSHSAKRSVAAETVIPTPVFDAWNSRASSGKSGCVQ